MRPWLTVRMPTFGFTRRAGEHDHLLLRGARGAAGRSSRGPAQADPRSLAVGGVVFGILQCARCHPSGGQPPRRRRRPRRTSRRRSCWRHDRLRHDWVPRLDQGPAGVDPGHPDAVELLPEAQPGESTSPYAARRSTRRLFAAQKQQMLRYFSSEAELKAYLSDADKVTGGAQRSHLDGSQAAAEPPAPGRRGGGAAAGPEPRRRARRARSAERFV